MTRGGNVSTRTDEHGDARIWSEPLTHSERDTIEYILSRGSGNDARRWLRFVLKVYDAREASRG